MILMKSRQNSIVSLLTSSLVIGFASIDGAFVPSPTCNGGISYSRHRVGTTHWNANVFKWRRHHHVHAIPMKNSDDDDEQERLNKLRDKITNAALLEALFLPGQTGNLFSMMSGRGRGTYDERQLSSRGGVGGGLIELELAGRGAVGREPENETDCFFLTPVTSSGNTYRQRQEDQSKRRVGNSISALAVPIPSSRYSSILKLLSYAYQNKRISKSLCLTLNPLIVNRDGSLFDNLPWVQWTIDPQLRNRDAANNPVETKYHLGKRDAYNRMMGKDWKGRSVSLGNIALRAKYMLLLEKETSENDNNKRKGKMDDRGSTEEKEVKSTLVSTDFADGNYFDDVYDDAFLVDMVKFDDEAATSLTKRVLELEIKEAKMELAEWEQRLAVSRAECSIFLTDDDFLNNNNNDNDDEIMDLCPENLRSAVEQVQKCRERLQSAQDNLRLITNPSQAPVQQSKDNIGGGSGKGGSSSASSSSRTALLTSILDEIASSSTNNGQNAPPYRGAMGYAPKLDTREEMFDESILPFTSPFDLLNEIINDQLHATVIGAVLENTSLFEGSVVLGGAIVLRRKEAKKVVKIDGQEVELNDEDEEFGNDGITAGETIIVECDSDEAIGMALACGIPVSVERDIWERAQMSVVTRTKKQSDDDEMKKDDGDEEQEAKGGEGFKSGGVMTAIPLVEAVDKSLIIRTEGEGTPANGTSPSARTSPLRIPQTTTSLFDTFFTASPETAFSTDNPIRSLSEYDALSTQDKAKILLSLDSFKGKLPRPRILRQAETSRTAASNDNASNDNSAEPVSNPLDKLLLPLIDESVRRQYLLRDAEQRGDYETVERLKQERSKRQMAKENAERARLQGLEDEAERWEREADLYGDLRADVTQDEGSYSRFLDRDEWYERNRRNIAKKLKKSNFGTLLDGIE